MKDSLLARCRSFIENRDIVKSAFPMESYYFHPICASFFTDRGVKADASRLKECRGLLKEKVGVFSNFRGAAELSIVAMLALEDDPNTRLDKAVELYKVMKDSFFGSEYLVLAAMILSGCVDICDYGKISERTRRIYDLMKREHPFLTSGEDSVFAAMLALSDRSDEEILGECEICYGILKERFHDRNAAQSLSHALALTVDEMRTASDKCRDTIRLFDILREKKYRYGSGYELPTLGVLATLPCGMDETVRDICEVSDFLKTQKGYGIFGFDRSQRMMHAGMIVTSECLGDVPTMQGAAVGCALSLIAAQQAAICAAMAASAAASSAASH